MQEKISPKTLKQLFTTMLTIRTVEEEVASVYPEQEIKCPVHLCTGQEAIAAGVCAHLAKEDTIFSTHRSHGHCIAKGMDLKPLVAELYGRTTGCAHGKGGSMHIVDPEHGIPGTTAIVGGCIPLAVGAALSSKLQRKTGRVSVAFFGDGAVDEGTFYESLNFASLRKLPVVFICENNNYATNSPRSARQPDVAIVDRSPGFGMPGAAGDGNDVLDVFRLAGEAVERARSGRGPMLLEFRTYRWKGHVGPTSDIEAGCRPADEHEEWMKKCPVDRYRAYLLENRVMTQDEIIRVTLTVEKQVRDAMEYGSSGPFPRKEDLLEHVW